MADLKYTVDVDTRGAQRALGGLKSALIALGTAIVTKEIIDVTARFEDLRTSLNTVTGSIKAGGEAFQFVSKFATQTQFGIEDLSKTFIQLKAAGIEPTEKLLRTFTDTAAVTTDQLGSLEAITALLSRTTGGGLGLEELERLADRGIPVYRILQQEIGLTRDRISEFGQTAEGARIIVDNLLAGLDKEVGGATEARLNNLSSIISNFRIAVGNLANEFGSGLAPAIKEITIGITDFIEANKGLARTIGESLGNAILKVRDLVKEMLDTIGLLQAGGIERFGAEITTALANFLEGLGQTVNTIVNTLLSVVNGLQQAIVAISNIPGIGFDAIYLDAGQSRDQYIADTKAKIEKFQKQLAESNANTISGAYQIEGFTKLIKDLEEELASLEDGTTIVFERIGTNFEGASTALQPFVDSLRETAEQLKEQSENVQENTTVFENYDDAILRVARAQEQANIAAAEAKRLTDALTVSVEGYVSASQKRVTASETEAELSALTGIQRTLEEIRREELRLAETAKKRVEEQFKNADPAKVNDALKAIDDQAKANIKARQDAARLIEENQKKQADAQKSFAEGWKDAFESYRKSATDAGKAAERIFTKTTKGIEDSIVSFVKTGKFEFKSLINDILEALLRSQIQQIIAQTFQMPFGNSGGTVGGGLSNLFAGFFANGGQIPAGKFGVVGERGPELISGPANITPFGGGSGVTYNINAVDAASFKQMVARDPGFIHAVASQGARKVPMGR